MTLIRKLSTYVAILLILFGFAGISKPYKNSEIKNIDEQNRLVVLAKVWGYLKYHHPNLAAGKVDWDSTLLATIPDILGTKTTEAYNQRIAQLILNAGETNVKENVSFDLPDTLEMLVDFDWMNDLNVFSNEVSTNLNKIRYAVPLDSNTYVQLYRTGIPHFEEATITTDGFPSEAVRLLALFRYWNAINYFYPYKDVMDKPWDEVLVEFIPKFRKLQNAEEYLWCVRELNAHLDDGHSSVRGRFSRNGLDYQVPIRLEYFGEKTVVSEILSDSILGVADIRVGDVILSKNDLQLSEIRDSLSRYFRKSHIIGTNKQINGFILMSYRESISLMVERGDQIHAVQVPTYNLKDRSLINRNSSKSKRAWKQLKTNIGYIDAGKLEAIQVDGMMDSLRDTKSLIVDLRRYPKSSAIDSLVCKYLSPAEVQFSLLKIPNVAIPGTFYYRPYYTGPKILNKDYYQGQVVILVSESTGSSGEFNTMRLQTLPKAYTIGRNTAGTDGNIVSILLPGALKVVHSGIGIYYPDSTQTQRVGVKIDQYVERTKEDVFKKEDSIFEAALDYLEN